MSAICRAATFLLLVAAFTASTTHAQAPGAGAAMPDARQMSGVPLPMADVPTGTVTVRVVRGEMSNPVVGHGVELVAGGGTLRQKTNDVGRAEFPSLPIGTRVRAVTTVDGERLESQEFPVPTSGGVRLVLVATNPGTAARDERDGGPAKAPAQPGLVVLGEQSRIVIELGEETLNVFNIMEVVNTARTPVQPPAPVVFELPPGSKNAGLLDGSSPQAKLAGKQVIVAGPFAPGKTLVQFAYAVPIRGGSLTVEQQFPSQLGAVNVMAQKVGDLHVTSPQLSQHREMAANGQTYLVAAGPALRSGDPLVLNFTGLPHAPTWPLRLALGIAVLILLAGAWGSVRGGRGTAPADAQRRMLEQERDRLFDELTELEEQRRLGASDADLYATRRRELIGALEQIFADLDEKAAA